LQPILGNVLAATTWRERETQLAAAYAIVATMHNALDVTDPLPVEVSNFHARPCPATVPVGGRGLAGIL
jgi:hypothetical protein